MKKYKIMHVICLVIAAGLLLVMIQACSRQVDQSQIIERNGVVYRTGEEEPFSGYVVGKGKEGYRQYVVSYKKKYKVGKLDGRSEFWYENGKLESMEPYENGELNGIVTRYWDNGQIRARIHFVEGMRGGEKGEMFWDQEGKRVKG